MATPDSKPKVKSVRDNGNGTTTLRDTDGLEQTLPTDEALVLIGVKPTKGDPTKFGKGMQDCMWCRYGKPAAVGAVAGLAVSSVAGYEPTRGLVWGAVGGLLYGQLRG